MLEDLSSNAYPAADFQWFCQELTSCQGFWQNFVAWMFSLGCKIKREGEGLAPNRKLDGVWPGINGCVSRLTWVWI